MPRPCVTQIRVSLLQIRSSTEQLVGPWLVAEQVAPSSSLTKTPTSVPSYHRFDRRGCTVTARTGAADRPAPRLRQVAPRSSLRQTLSATYPPKVATTTSGSCGDSAIWVQNRPVETGFGPSPSIRCQTGAASVPLSV